MRLFLASFASVTDYPGLKARFDPYFEGKWVEPRNLHLTWYFLGEHPSPHPFAERLQALKMIPRLPLGIHGIRLFGRQEPTHLVLTTPPAVAGVLHQKIAELLGMEPDKNFTPHVTLARIKKIRKEGLTQAIDSFQPQELGSVEKEIYLIESRLTPTGPVYLPLEEF